MDENRNSRGRLQILQVVDGFRLGGAEKKLLELIVKLDKQKFDVMLANVGPSGALEKEFCQIGIDVFQFPRRFAFDPLPAWRLYRLIRQRRIDIVQTTLLWADMVGAVAARLARVPVTISWETVSHEGNPFHKSIQRRVGYAVAMKCVDVIVPVSEEIKYSLMRRRGIPEHKIRVIHYGVDLQKFHPNGYDAALAKRRELAFSTDNIIIGIFARLDTPKGHRIFLDAFPEVVKCHPQVRAIFVGDGPLRSELEMIIKQRGLGNHVILLGTRSDVHEIMNATDLVVVPSISEGLPNALLEAMASRKPIIASKVGGIPEIIRHGENGYLVPPGDTSALRQSLLERLTEPEQWQALALKAYNTVVDEFSLEHQIAGFEAIFEELYAAKVRRAVKTSSSYLTQHGS